MIKILSLIFFMVASSIINGQESSNPSDVYRMFGTSTSVVSAPSSISSRIAKTLPTTPYTAAQEVSQTPPEVFEKNQEVSPNEVIGFTVCLKCSGFWSMMIVFSSIITFVLGASISLFLEFRRQKQKAKSNKRVETGMGKMGLIVASAAVARKFFIFISLFY